jgi:AcrR family transcriptional regulator
MPGTGSTHVSPPFSTTSALRAKAREETNALILDAAEAVIGELGLHAAKMERIAARADVSVGTLYNHFADRSALIESLYAARAVTLHDVLQLSLSEARGRPIRTQVEILFAAMREHARDHRPLFTALLKEQQGPTRLRAPPVARAELEASARELVARGIASGELRADAPALLAEALISLARLVLLRSVEEEVTAEELSLLAGLFSRGATP